MDYAVTGLGVKTSINQRPAVLYARVDVLERKKNTKHFCFFLVWEVFVLQPCLVSFKETSLSQGHTWVTECSFSLKKVVIHILWQGINMTCSLFFLFSHSFFLCKALKKQLHLWVFVRHNKVLHLWTQLVATTHFPLITSWLRLHNGTVHLYIGKVCGSANHSRAVHARLFTKGK